MKYKLMLTAVGAFALGALAVQGIHAQMKPPAYFIGENNITDMDKYRSEFLPLAQKSIAEGGGKYIAGGSPVAIEGAAPGNRVVILQFESMDKLKAWSDSSNQKDMRKVGDKYATFRVYMIEGLAQ